MAGDLLEDPDFFPVATVHTITESIGRRSNLTTDREYVADRVETMGTVFLGLH